MKAFCLFFFVAFGLVGALGMCLIEWGALPKTQGRETLLVIAGSLSLLGFFGFFDAVCTEANEQRARGR